MIKKRRVGGADKYKENGEINTQSWLWVMENGHSGRVFMVFSAFCGVLQCFAVLTGVLTELKELCADKSNSIIQEWGWECSIYAVIGKQTVLENDKVR